MTPLEYQQTVRGLLVFVGGDPNDVRVPALCETYLKQGYGAMDAARQIMQDLTDGAYLREVEQQKHVLHRK